MNIFHKPFKFNLYIKKNLNKKIYIFIIILSSLIYHTAVNSQIRGQLFTYAF